METTVDEVREVIARYILRSAASNASTEVLLHNAAVLEDFFMDAVRWDPVRFAGLVGLKSGASVYAALNGVFKTLIMNTDSERYATIRRVLAEFIEPSLNEYNPSGNYCSVCKKHDQWCEHIKEPAGAHS